MTATPSTPDAGNFRSNEVGDLHLPFEATKPSVPHPRAITSTPAIRMRQRASQKWRLRTLVALDVLSILTGLLVASLFQWGVSDLSGSTVSWLWTFTLAISVWLIMLWKLQSRRIGILGDGPEEYRRVLRASTYAGVIVAAIAFVLSVNLAPQFLLGGFAVGTAVMVTSRHLARRATRQQRVQYPALHQTFVVSSTGMQDVVRQYLEKTEGLFQNVGAWTLMAGADPDPTRVVNAAVRAGANTLVYVPASHDDPEWPRQLSWAMETKDMDLFVVPSLTQVAEPRLSLQPVEGMPLLKVEMPNFSGPARVAKRLIDVVGAVLALVLLSIPWLIITAMIRMTSDGPAIYKQTRVGSHGELFTCWKFRTMYQGADAERQKLRAESGQQGQAFKLRGDPRVTSFGHFLRKFSIDELPQLINVLQGHMSLIGPRPHPCDDVAEYDRVAHRRLLAKPGLTGLWQVSGRSELDWDEAIALDLYYVENWSLSMDFLIALRTAKAVLAGKGAY